MSTGHDDEEILNVFREELDDPHTETLTTDQLADELGVVLRTAQDYVRDLEKKNRLVLELEGKPNRWRLDDAEPTDPVYHPKLAKAKRLSNRARSLGNWSTLFCFVIYATVGFVTSNQVFSTALGVSLPLLDAQDVVVAGMIGGVGSVLFGVAFLAYVASVILPRIVEWWLDNPVSN